MCHWEAEFTLPDGSLIKLTSTESQNKEGDTMQTAFGDSVHLAFGEDLSDEQRMYFGEMLGEGLAPAASTVVDSRQQDASTTMADSIPTSSPVSSILEELIRRKSRLMDELDTNLSAAEWFGAYMISGAIIGIFVALPIYVFQIYLMIPGVSTLMVDPVYTTTCMIIAICMTMAGMKYLATECHIKYFIWALTALYYVVGIAVTLGGGYFPVFSGVLVASMVTGSFIGAIQAWRTGYSLFNS